MELLGEHSLDGSFILEFLFLQGDGVGGGLVAVRFGAGVLLAVLIQLVLHAVNGKGGLVLAELVIKVSAALSNKHLVVKVLSSYVRALGLFGDGPLCLGDIAHKLDVPVAIGDQVFLGLVGVILEQGLPCKGFLLGVGQFSVGDGIGGSDLVTVLVRGDYVKAGKATLRIVLALSAFRQSGHGVANVAVAGDLVVVAGLRLGPGDLAMGHYSRTGEDVVLHIGDGIRILARDGGINGILDSSGFDLCALVRKAVGLAVYGGGKDAAFIPVKFACIDFLLQLCQSIIIGDHDAGSLVQSLPQRCVLDLVLGFFLVGSLGGALLGLGDADINGQVPAECGVLVHSQLYLLAVVGTVVDIAALNGVAGIVQLGNDLSVGQLIGAGGVDRDGVLPDGAILGSLGVGVLAVLYAIGVLAARFLQHLVQLGAGQGPAVIRKLDFRKHHIGGDSCFSVLLKLLTGDGQVGGGLDGDGAAGDGDVGGAGLLVALLVQILLGTGQGVAAVRIHGGLVSFQQFGDLLGGHLAGLGLFLAEHQSLLGAGRIVLDFLHLVAIADVGVLGGIPGDVRVHLAQFLLKVDVLLGGLGDNFVQICLGVAGTGGGSGLGAGGDHGILAGKGTIKVDIGGGLFGGIGDRLCTGVGLLLGGLGVHLLGLFCLTDLFALFGQVLFLLGGVAGGDLFLRLFFGFFLRLHLRLFLGGLILLDDVAFQSGGIIGVLDGVLMIVLDFGLTLAQHRSCLFGVLLVHRGFFRRGLLVFAGGSILLLCIGRGSVNFVRSGSVSRKGLRSNTGGQSNSSGSELEFLVRHDGRLLSDVT